MQKLIKSKVSSVKGKCSSPEIWAGLVLCAREYPTQFLLLLSPFLFSIPRDFHPTDSTDVQGPWSMQVTSITAEVEKALQRAKESPHSKGDSGRWRNHFLGHLHVSFQGSSGGVCVLPPHALSRKAEKSWRGRDSLSGSGSVCPKCDEISWCGFVIKGNGFVQLQILGWKPSLEIKSPKCFLIFIWTNNI